MILEDPNYRTALHLMINSMVTEYDQHKNRNHQLVLELGMTPDILIQYGYNQLPIAITGKTIDKAYFDHGITKPILERTYKILESPKAIYEANNNDAPDGTVLISYETNNANMPLIIAIHPNKQIGRSLICNAIASIYFKGGDAEKRWKDMNLLRWEAFKK